VVPPSLKVNWREEFKVFTRKKPYVHILQGNNNHARIVDLMKAMATANVENSDYCVIICTYDVIPNSLALFQSVPWDLCLIDEAQMIKDPKTKRCKTLLELRKTCIRKGIPLTGTPICN